MNFKNRHCTCLACASPQPGIKKKNPKTQRNFSVVRSHFLHLSEIIQPSLKTDVSFYCVHKRKINYSRRSINIRTYDVMTFTIMAILRKSLNEVLHLDVP